MTTTTTTDEVTHPSTADAFRQAANLIRPYAPNMAYMLECDADAEERPRLAPVECFPWCTDGNGHGRDILPEDQTCFSVPVQIPGSLLRPDPEDTDGEPEYVAVHAQAWANGALPTMIHIGQSENYGLAVTPDEARQVAEALIAAADLIEAVA